MDSVAGDARRSVSINDVKLKPSVTGALVVDPVRHLIFVADEANSRIAIVEARKGKVLGSISLAGEPAAVALSPDRMGLWVATGDSGQVCTIGVADSSKPSSAECIEVPGSPSGILVEGDRVFVSRASDDAITVISAASHQVTGEISLAVPSLESLKGVMPAGMAYDPLNHWLLVAEAGVNAVGVVDVEKSVVLGAIPAGWMPTDVAIAGDRVFVANARGSGVGPLLHRPQMLPGQMVTPATMAFGHGSVTTFVMPNADEVPGLASAAFSYEGFIPSFRDAAKPPEGLKRVVLIVKNGRSFDDILGDVVQAGNGPVAGLVPFARFGLHARAMGGTEQFSVQDASITPNQHAMARQWSFSDNFYSDGDLGSQGYRWLSGELPDLASMRKVLGSWDQAARGGATAGADRPALWQHFDRNGIKYRSFSGGPSFIAAMDGYGKGGEEPPQFLRVDLPGDDPSDWTRDTQHPFAASWIAEKDREVGRILEHLSHSPWWKEMAVFVTEGSAEDGIDHIDSHRTLLLAAGPYMKKNYASHTNTSFPGLLKTIFQILHVPPLNLMDATAADLEDLFTAKADFSPYQAVEPDVRVLPKQ